MQSPGAAAAGDQDRGGAALNGSRAGARAGSAGGVGVGAALGGGLGEERRGGAAAAGGQRGELEREADNAAAATTIYALLGPSHVPAIPLGPPSEDLAAALRCTQTCNQEVRDLAKSVLGWDGDARFTRADNLAAMRHCLKQFSAVEQSTRAAGVDAGGQGGGYAGESMEAVSYTHLTLPTICSV
eukprot:2464753-Rhodomonas_salina.1